MGFLHGCDHKDPWEERPVGGFGSGPLGTADS